MKSPIRQLAHCFCAIAIVCWNGVCSLITETKYVKTSLCNAQDRINNACFVPVPATDRMSCLVSCSNSATCADSVLISPSSMCYHAAACGFVPVCSVIEPDYVHYINIKNIMTTEPMTTEPMTTEPLTTEPMTTESMTTEPMTTEPQGCQNGGIEDSVTGDCDCTGTGGYIGTKCQTKASGCAQLKANGYSSGTYSVNMDLFGDGSVIFQTYCKIKSFSNSFEILRNSGSFDKTLTYNDYVNGFYQGPNDFFVGLENLHRFTSDGQSHFITTAVFFYSSSVQGSASRGHNNFVVQSASNDYRYSCGGSSSSSTSISVSSGSSAGFGLTDMLSSQVNTPFSTADNDVDGSSTKNCAQLAQAGWWFAGCSPYNSNPLGWSYSAKPGSTTDSHFHVPGLDMSRSSVQEAFQYFTMSFDE